MHRLILAVILSLFALVEVAPAFAQSDDRLVVAQQQQKRRTLMDLLFGDENKASAPIEQPRQQRRTQPAQQQPRQAPRQRAPQAAVQAAKPAVEKAANATRVAVFGDSMAVDVAKGLQRFYAEDANLVIIEHAEGSSGFVREDHFNWETAISEQIAANSFDLAIVIIGVNDRQELQADGKVYEPLTPGWNAIYQQRITSFLNQLRVAGKPTIWVGLPPMEKTDYSTAISQINAIQRLASFAGGAEFVDIYERFLDEDGDFTAFGPDVSGQNARMRKDDGIHFSAAGADKLAFYLSQTIKVFYRGSGLSIQIADPLAGTDAATMVRLPYQGLGQTRLLEVAGAVIPLSQSANRAGELVLGGGVAAAPAFSLDQLMAAPAGRVDAFGAGVQPGATP